MLRRERRHQGKAVVQPTSLMLRDCASRPLGSDGRSTRGTPFRRGAARRALGLILVPVCVSDDPDLRHHPLPKAPPVSAGFSPRAATACWRSCRRLQLAQLNSACRAATLPCRGAAVSASQLSRHVCFTYPAIWEELPASFVLNEEAAYCRLTAAAVAGGAAASGCRCRWPSCTAASRMYCWPCKIKLL